MTEALARPPADAFTEDSPRRAARPVATLGTAATRALGLAVPPLAVAPLWAGLHPALAGAVPVAAFLAFGAPLAMARATRRHAPLPDATGPLGALLSALLVGVAVTGASSLVGLGGAAAVAQGALIPARRLAPALVSGVLALSMALVVAGASATAVVADACVFLGFGVLGQALFFGTLRAVQVREAARVDSELLRIYDDARLFGLVGSAELDDDAARERRLVAQTLAARDGCYRLLRLGARALRPDAAALYLLDGAGQELVLKEQLLEVDDEMRPRVSATAGALGLALERQQPIRLMGTDAPGVQPHRRGARSVLCLPLRDGAQLRGVLVFDRGAGRGPPMFTEDDETFAVALCEELVALLRTERVLERLDAEYKKIQRIFRAARAFGGVVRLEDTMEQTLQATMDLAPQASAAVVELVRDDERTALCVRKVAGPQAEALVCPEAVPVDDEAWVGRAILQRTVLPHVALVGTGSARGLYLPGDARTARLGDVRVMPLFAQGEAIGALVVAVAPGERLKPAAVDALVVVADLAGVALGGARLFETVERQATTDGLTGLANRRTLDARLVDALARARRMRTPLCVVLTDVDHFKSVNDTHGHSTGDEVLKGVAAALRTTARASDVVARYGGEEFCLVLEGTDAAGAGRLAERMRLAIKALRFDSEKGPLQVTSSFGVSMFAPDDNNAVLLERADQQLYAAKQAGRDRVMVEAA